MKRVLGYLIVGTFRLCRDIILMFYIKKRRSIPRRSGSLLLRNWFLPIGLSLVFIMLFSLANPIISRSIDKIHLQILKEYFSIPRILFWGIASFYCWALIRPRFKKHKAGKKQQNIKQNISIISFLFNERSILISLALFNCLFFLQNMLDIVFLWGSADLLPEGMTHAQYTHRGAYPLIITAILAAIFVLIALKSNIEKETVPIINWLLYVWVGQNIFLVFSSIARLMNYIEEYSLTYMRVFALIWMMLVVFGLISIIIRIYLNKSNVWIININSIMLYATLYFSCFINFGGIIADYNIKHSREVTGRGVNLDSYYLQRSVGIEAIPALLWFEKNHPKNLRVNEVMEIRKHLEIKMINSMQGWRKWTFRKYRLSKSIQYTNYNNHYK